MLPSLFGMMRGMNRMPVGGVRMVRGPVVLLAFMMLGRLPVMLGCLFMMLGRLPVMLCAFVLRHGDLRRLRAYTRV